MLRASLLTSHASCNQMLLTMTPLILCSINWPNFIAWLPLQLNILGNMCIAIVVFSGCETINFEINWNFENCVRPEKAASKRTWLIRQILKDPFYALFAVVKPSLVFFLETYCSNVFKEIPIFPATETDLSKSTKLRPKVQYS